ncbi:MAG: response regulator [Roseiflexaceae bacterium]|nr:response regulator [Roseiflexaceae bacterium]
MKILLIEDDQRLARLIARVLHDEHYQVDVVHDGDTGLDYALRGVYEVAIIDWMLPGRDGPSICRAVRAARLPTALLILTARGQIEDKMIGFDSGADDYLVKPFAFDRVCWRGCGRLDGASRCNRTTVTNCALAIWCSTCGITRRGAACARLISRRRSGTCSNT